MKNITLNEAIAIKRAARENCAYTEGFTTRVGNKFTIHRFNDGSTITEVIQHDKVLFAVGLYTGNFQLVYNC